MPCRSRLILLAGALAMCAAAPAFSQPVRVSVATDGTPANASSFQPVASADGRFVAFITPANNLVPGDTNGVEDVFLRDRDTDADGVFDEAGAVSTVRVSERNGIQGNGESVQPAITPDGRYIVFSSRASTLFAVNQPPLAAYQIVRWDRLTGAIVLVSQNAQGEPLDGHCSQPAVTADGNTVYFVSYATNDGAGPPLPFGFVFRRDIAGATLARVSDPILAPPGAGHTPFSPESPTVSDDGSVVAYAVTSYISGSAVGGATYVQAAGQPVRLYTGASPKLSADGQFLGLFDGTARQIHLPSGQVVKVGTVPIPNLSGVLSRSGRYMTWGSKGIVDFVYGSVVPAPWSNTPTGGHAGFAGDTHLVYTIPEFVPMRFLTDVIVAPLATLFDVDGDGLNDHWETAMGSSIAPGSGATGVDGPDGDPDTDGLTNAQEFARGSHPRGTAARYLAEGASGSFFTTRYAVANPNAGPASVALRLDLAGGGALRRSAVVDPGRTVNFDSRALGLGTASFSAVVESDVPVVVDRLMTWGDAQGIPYGSHAETSSAAPATSWLLAEGSTVLDFQLFYLLQNPQTTPTTATVRYLLPSGAPVVRTYDLPAESRTTIYVNTVPGLESTDVSAAITATQPIAVERAMYRSAPGQPFALGHAAAGVTAPSASWFFGEGATGAFFDTYLLLANPSAQAAVVSVDYLRDNEGTVSRTYTVPANSRFSVYVDGEPGMEATAFGTRVMSSVPIVAERAMYWAGGFFDYYEGHVSAGATQTGSRWVLAGAEEVGPNAAYTFVLIANTGAAPATVMVSTLPETGPGTTSDPIEIPAHSRLTFPLAPGVAFRGGVEVREVVAAGGTPTGALVVEGSLYWNAGGRLFGAGANWPATLIP